MNRVMIGLAAACVFISGVMIFLIQQGVHLRERRMVKWSRVDSAEAAGKKISDFMYPILKQYDQVSIKGPGNFSHRFFNSYQREAKKNQTSATLNFGSKNIGGFLIEIRSLDLDDVAGCEKGDAVACIAVKAQGRLSKKKRDPGLWINMYRTSETDSVLFFKEIK